MLTTSNSSKKCVFGARPSIIRNYTSDVEGLVIHALHLVFCRNCQCL